MKHKFSNRELFHIFFHRPEGQEYAEGSSCSWRDNICYSYSSELGYADFENKIFYFRSGHYSSSTCKHQNYLWRAIPKGEWYVVRIDEWWDWVRGYNKAPDLTKWVRTRLNWYLTDKKKLSTGTKDFGNPLFYNQTIDCVQEVLFYCNQMHLYQPFLDKMIRNQWTDTERKIWRVKDWCLENGITGSYETKLKIFENPELAKEVIKKNRIRKEHLEATKEERRLKAIQKNIEKWYLGEVRELSSNITGISRKQGYWHISSIYLRINPNDANEVETSKGAKVTLQKAKLLYYKFKKCKETNTPWFSNGEQFSLGYYSVNSITERTSNKDSSGLEWCITAGCHQVFDTQIEEFVNRFTDWNKNE